MRPGPWGRAGATSAAPAAAAAAEPVSHYPCRACGAQLGYRPGETRLVCGFCGAETEIPALDDAAREAAALEQDFEAALAGGGAAAPEEVTQVARCQSCGAAVEFDPDQHAGRCPFCASPIVADPAPDRHIRPQAVLPFAIDEAEARAAVRRWFGRLWFAPSGLARYARQGSRLDGVYTPFWTFDARADTAYAGQRGDTTMVRGRGPDGKPRMVPRTRWRPARGRLSRRFDDVLTSGSTALPEREAEAIGPWDLSGLKPYARDWLAGFRAEAYGVDLRAAFARARAAMEAAILGDVRRAIGGDQQRVERVDTRLSDVTFKHVLLPVWIGAYRWRGRAYRVLVNGRTGRVTGGRPWSVWKLALAGLGLLLVAALALALAAAEGGR